MNLNTTQQAARKSPVLERWERRDQDVVAKTKNGVSTVDRWESVKSNVKAAFEGYGISLGLLFQGMTFGVFAKGEEKAELCDNPVEGVLWSTLIGAVATGDLVQSGIHGALGVFGL